MIKIKTKIGAWQGGPPVETLYFETCPTPNCEGGELHYPSDLERPYCPICRYFLKGPNFLKRQDKHIAYHLEV